MSSVGKNPNRTQMVDLFKADLILKKGDVGSLPELFLGCSSLEPITLGQIIFIVKFHTLSNKFTMSIESLGLQD